MKKIIGYYRDCDFLTMTGTSMALLGIVFAINGNKLLPIFCLILSGICDAFDGKLARRRESTKEQNVYGVQLDSLSDLISFGVFPLVLTVTCLPKNCYLAWVAMIFDSLCGMIRLAYFNTLDICNKSEKGYFIGAPITTISIIYPIVYLICFFNKFEHFPIISSIFFISNIPLKYENFDKDEIIKEYLDGKTYNELAREYSTHSMTIKYVLLDNNV